MQWGYNFIILASSVIVVKRTLPVSFDVNVSYYLNIDPKWLQVSCIWNSVTSSPGVSPVSP
jgi:hypothetical protein